MKHHVPVTLWIKAGLASVSALAAVLAVSLPDWIERVLNIDPDHRSGSLEWTIAVAFVLNAALFAALTRRTWRQSHTS